MSQMTDSHTSVQGAELVIGLLSFPFGIKSVVKLHCNYMSLDSEQVSEWSPFSGVRCCAGLHDMDKSTLFYLFAFVKQRVARPSEVKKNFFCEMRRRNSITFLSL